jgi:hypothetical protein
MISKLLGVSLVVWGVVVCPACGQELSEKSLALPADQSQQLKAQGQQLKAAPPAVSEAEIKRICAGLSGTKLAECRGTLLYRQTQPVVPREAYSSVVIIKRVRTEKGGKVQAAPAPEKLFLADDRTTVEVKPKK